MIRNEEKVDDHLYTSQDFRSTVYEFHLEKISCLLNSWTDFPLSLLVDYFWPLFVVSSW